VNESWFDSPEARAREAKEKERDAQSRAKAAESLRLDMEARARSIGIYERTVETVFGGIQATDATAAVEHAAGTVVLSGGPGCGKTVAAAMWLTDPMRMESSWRYTDQLAGVFGRCGNAYSGPKCVWITAAKLARAERYDDEKMTELLRCDRLVIDDLGGEYLDKGGFYASMLDEIINERHAAKLPTVMTTNLNDTAFKARYGERISDRIRESGRFIGCGNASMRRRT
jgi:DNA replication protein DnaC